MYKVAITVLDDKDLVKIDEVAASRGFSKVELHSEDGGAGYDVTMHAETYIQLARSASLLGYDVSEIEVY